MASTFSGMDGGLNGPCRHAAAVTPSDSTDLATHARCLFIGTGGDLKVVTVGGDEITFCVLDGQMLPFMIKRVKATGTTATDIVAGW